MASNFSFFSPELNGFPHFSSSHFPPYSPKTNNKKIRALPPTYTTINHESKWSLFFLWRRRLSSDCIVRIYLGKRGLSPTGRRRRK